MNTDTNTDTLNRIEGKLDGLCADVPVLKAAVAVLKTDVAVLKADVGRGASVGKLEAHDNAP